MEASEWLPQVQRIMQVAGAAVDLIDVQGSSVMLCLEDGWDLTAQVRRRRAVELSWPAALPA